MCLQEVHKSSLDRLYDTFSKDYELYETRHSSRGGCCFLVTLVRKPIVFKSGAASHYSTSFYNKFRDNEEMVSCVNVVEFVDFAVVNVHSPMAEDLRFKTNGLLKGLCGEGKTLVVMGDMNTFIDARGNEQIQELVDEGFSHAKLNVVTTFQPCPYDKVPEGAEPCVLDHVFYTGCEVEVDNDSPHPLLKDRPESDREDRWLSDHLPTRFAVTFN